MAMTISTSGLDDLSAMLAKLGEKAQDVASGALFDGAGVVADAMSAAINGIHTEPFKYATGGQKRYPSPEEKAALTGKSGIAKFNKGGEEVNTLIGISGAAGYSEVAGKSKAVRLIARSINSGTSFMHKQPVFRKAVSGSSGAAKQAIVSKAEQMFNEIIGG
ncbi:MAG: hypothetical protein J6U01_01930 [Clostridia bacterium]|nr:hypothetical protein [Clostridia bacterium]